MKKLFCFGLAILLLLLCACAENKTEETDAPAQSVGPADVSNPQEGTASAYSISKEDLLGTWQLSFYSYDNEQYFDYEKDISDVGSYTFYSDGIAVLRNSETDEMVYRYVLPENQAGNILFYDTSSGEPAPFFFGYGIVTNEGGRCLIISKYNASDGSIEYLILREVF